MIKYRTKLIEKNTHGGRSTANLVKTRSEFVPPPIISCMPVGMTSLNLATLMGQLESDYGPLSESYNAAPRSTGDLDSPGPSITLSVNNAPFETLNLINPYDLPLILQYGGDGDASANAEDMGLRADYSGTGWYKATDTGTVFNKGIPEGETHVFSDFPTEYVSVYTKEDAKLYHERAAVSNITDMSSWFDGDTEFNQDISSWDVSNVTDMSYMFLDAYVFNSDISNWNVSSVTSMKSMFDGAKVFNQDLSSWDVSKVTEMVGMFYGTSFNQDISSWDVSSVTNMRIMFGYSSFNSNISSWDVSNVTDMLYMFYKATSFNQDLSDWCVTLLPTKPSDFDLSVTSWTLPRPVWGTCPGRLPTPSL